MFHQAQENGYSYYAENTLVLIFHCKSPNMSKWWSQTWCIYADSQSIGEGHHASQVGNLLLTWFPHLFVLDKLVIAKEGQDTKLVESRGRISSKTKTQHSLPTWLLNDNFLTLSLPNLLCLNGILFETLNIFLYWPSVSLRIFDLNDYGQVAL